MGTKGLSYQPDAETQKVLDSITGLNSKQKAVALLDALLFVWRDELHSNAKGFFALLDSDFGGLWDWPGWEK